MMGKTGRSRTIVHSGVCFGDGFFEAHRGAGIVGGDFDRGYLGYPLEDTTPPVALTPVPRRPSDYAPYVDIRGGNGSVLELRACAGTAEKYLNCGVHAGAMSVAWSLSYTVEEWFDLQDISALAVVGQPAGRLTLSEHLKGGTRVVARASSGSHVLEASVDVHSDWYPYGATGTGWDVGGAHYGICLLTPTHSLQTSYELAYDGVDVPLSPCEYSASVRESGWVSPATYDILDTIDPLVYLESQRAEYTWAAEVTDASALLRVQRVKNLTYYTGDLGTMRVCYHPAQRAQVLGRACRLDGSIDEQLTARITHADVGSSEVPAVLTEDVTFSGGFVREVSVNNMAAVDVWYTRLAQPIVTNTPGPLQHIVLPGAHLVVRPITLNGGPGLSPQSVALTAESVATASEDGGDVNLTLLTWPWDTGVTLQQAGSWTVDACDSVAPTGELLGTWAGGAGETCVVDAGIRLDTTGASSLVRTFGYRMPNIGAFRYLRFTLTGPACNVAVEITDRDGYVKSWTTDYAGNALAPGTSIIDLCCPTSETAATDTVDTWLVPDGPYTGVTACSRIEFGGLAAASTYRLSLLENCRI